MTETITSGTPLRWRRAVGHRLTGRLRRALGARSTAVAASRPTDGSEVAFPLGEDAGIAGRIGSGTRLCRHVDLYHDGDAEAVSCTCPQGQALSLSCGAFGGSYLSLVAAVPEALVARFGPGQVLRLLVDATASRPIVTYLRLNVGSADGHEVFYETLLIHRGRRAAAFDLDGMRLPFDGTLRAWADMIFAQPGDVEIAIPDLRLRLIGKHEL